MFLNSTIKIIFIRQEILCVSSRADIGLMYVNDAKTFSISGSIGIERDNYPAFQYNQFNPSKQNPALLNPNR